MTNDKITKFYLTFLKRPHIFVAFSEYINFSKKIQQTLIGVLHLWASRRKQGPATRLNIGSSGLTTVYNRRWARSTRHATHGPRAHTGWLGHASGGAHALGAHALGAHTLGAHTLRAHAHVALGHTTVA